MMNPSTPLPSAPPPDEEVTETQEPQKQIEEGGEQDSPESEQARGGDEADVDGEQEGEGEEEGEREGEKGVWGQGHLQGRLYDFPHGLPHGKGPDEVGGIEYPIEQPPYEVPHNPLRFLKKFPKKLIPKILKLFHLDTVLQEIMLSVIAIDDDTLRNEVATELSRVADRLQEPLDKFSDMLGNSIRGVLSAAVPVLGGFYVVNDMANAYKTTAEVQEQALGPLNDFVTKVKDLYDSSVESNRLLSSMIYAGIDTVTDEKWKRLLEAKRNESVGRAVEGAVEDRPPTKEMARLLASGLTRNVRENLGAEQISGLLGQLRKQGPEIVSKITDLEPSEQQAALGTGESLLSFLTANLEKKYGKPSTDTDEDPAEPKTEKETLGADDDEDPASQPTNPSKDDDELEPTTETESKAVDVDIRKSVSEKDKESLKKAIESIKKLAEMTPDLLKALETIK
jgi:hypothetical protein